MWFIDTLELKNLLSHEDTKVVFKNDVLTIITGYNQDDNSSSSNSNGSGKSVIVEGVTIGLTGETYREISKDEWIKDDCDTCDVTICLTNKFIKKSLKIHWHFKRGKSAKCEIFSPIDSKQPEPLISIAECKKYIFETLGITKDDLLNYYIINQGNNNNFFTCGDAKQKEIISRFTNFSIVEKVINVFESELDSLNKQRSDLELKISNQNSIKQSFETLIEEENEKLQSDSKQQISEINELIKICDLELTKNKKSLKDKQIEEFKTSGLIQNLIDDIESYDEILNESEQISDENENLNDDINELKSCIKSNNNIIKGAIHCPKCNHEFILSSDKSLSELERENQINQSKIDEKQKLVSHNEELLKSFDETKQLLKSCNSEKRELKSKLNEIVEDIDDIQSSISKIDKSIEKHKKAIEDLKSKKVEDSQIPNYNLKISEVDKVIVELQKTLNSTIELINDKNYWLLHLGRRGFQTYLVNKCIGTIQSVTNSFLKQMGSNLRVSMSGYKILKSGELREKIDIKIIKDGCVERVYNGCSGGQKMRVNIAVTLALQSIMNTTNETGGLNFIAFDENLDHLDTSGMKTSLKILEELRQTILIISHNDIDGLINNLNSIKVKYVDGVSQII